MLHVTFFKLFSYIRRDNLIVRKMKIILLSIFLAVSPLIVLTAAACPDCVNDIDLTDKKSVITCVVTVLFGLIVRHIERRKLRKKLDDKDINE